MQAPHFTPALTCQDLMLLKKSNFPMRIFDLRKAQAFAENPVMLQGARRLEPWLLPQHLAALKAEPDRSHPLVMVCVHGHQVSQTAQIIATCHGFSAAYLIGGLEGWRERGLPMAAANEEGV